MPRREGPKNGRISASDAGWSSLAARRAHNPKVVGSNPAPATKYQTLSLQNARVFCLPFAHSIITKLTLSNNIFTGGPDFFLIFWPYT